jgi:hypothetical protein
MLDFETLEIARSGRTPVIQLATLTLNGVLFLLDTYTHATRHGRVMMALDF